MTVHTTDASARTDALADILVKRGHLTSPRIRDALRAAPRHLFAPARGWYATDGPGPRYAIDRDRDPATWWDAVYANGSIVTQVDDGAGDPTLGVAEATSSLSSPGIVVAFLELLDVQPGDRILEVGTGTGWTAALLTALGADVTTVEVDAGLADTACQTLTMAGFTPLIVTGDGALGVPDRAPFDGVHVTCGVDRVPYAWVEQTRPGGRIVVPWMPEYGDGHQALLTVTGDGHAVGRLVDSANYMVLRAQRSTLYVPEHTAAAVETTTRLDPREVTASPGADVAITAALPDVMGAPRDRDGVVEVELADTAGTSWARVRQGEGEHRVWQAGPRRLWDEVASAYARWTEWGRPGREEFGLTVGPDRQVVWRDDPSNIISP
ncbi:protein-L-isoaspartate(D-aspartate) O-methyltransferase [Actinomadura litoris]|uniref:protein-L-isoaspartate(D-aspartate) O-methyltransferase n=1 Tax=Actinomadura litoris TaxID=2678616 RepID=UPI001FA6F57E|nr:protein-L-isoaspartate(D-aspartate) O-methyltransferase [Actinomadura litoris]